MKARPARILSAIETTDIEMPGAKEANKEYVKRRVKLEVAAEEARALLKDRRRFLVSADTSATFTQELREVLRGSELIERRGRHRALATELVEMPGDALVRYTIPLPDDRRMLGGNSETLALDSSTLSAVERGGLSGIRSHDLSYACLALYSCDSDLQEPST